MKVLGIESGIGSMLIGAKELGHEIVGNFESRNDFHSGTWNKNFEDSYMTHNYSRLKRVKDIDIVFSHPSCGDFSSLNTSKNKGQSKHKTFELVADSINMVRPSFFLVDNLPKSLIFYPSSWWSSKLPDYDITTEYVCNYNYGNVQLKRNRLFIIGSLKEFKFVFKPGEVKNNLRVRHVLRGMEKVTCNQLLGDDEKAPGFQPYTIKTVKPIVRKLQKGGNVFYKGGGQNVKYSSKKVGKCRIGLQLLDINKPSPTITSSLAFYRHDLARPLTCRERARIQGIPDWFDFNFPRNGIMGAQTGKCIPVEFTRFFTKQVTDFLNGNEIHVSGKRSLNDKIVNSDKVANCKLYGHSNQERLCELCSGQCEIKNG